MIKQHEIELLAQFVRTVPRGSYLESFLEGALDSFERSIAQDLCFPTLAQCHAFRQEESIELEKFRAETKATIDKLRGEVRELERRAAIAKNELAEIRTTASRLCKV